MSLRGMIQKDNGQTVPIEYILISSILVVFFGLLILSMSSFTNCLSNQAMRIEFTDIGNQVSSAITNAYLSTPIYGEKVSIVDIPTAVGGVEYLIEITDENPFQHGKKIVQVTSMSNDMTVYVPLSNVDEVVDVSGTTYSISEKIVITSTMNSITIS